MSFTGERIGTGTTTFVTAPSITVPSFTTSYTGQFIDEEAFLVEWKKLRLELLPLLLKDNSYPIKKFSMQRIMDTETKQTKVILQLEYIPLKEPKKGVRRTL